MNTKLIAYYLPQYHEIKENDEWWGKGFTEWTHVKAARKLFSNQRQPRVPLNNNYYCLMDKSTVEWQTTLAQKYGIYGFAYYHYWYEGKLLLEKPAENLLNWKDIPQKFFFFWANHTWYKAESGKKKVLISQQYGDVKDWIDHYNYMRPFFLDDRYIKIDNKPIIGIFNPGDVKNLNGMIQKWNAMAKEDSFNGVYIIESKSTAHQQKQSIYSDALVARQPLIAMNQYLKMPVRRVYNKIHSIVVNPPKQPMKIDYSKIQKLELTYKPEKKNKEFLGIGTGWDNTPRHGNWGQLFINESSKAFGNELRALIKKSEKMGNEFLFINAWNEWAEGMYLEPDTDNGYAYLDEVKKAITSLEDQ